MVINTDRICSRCRERLGTGTCENCHDYVQRNFKLSVQDWKDFWARDGKRR